MLPIRRIGRRPYADAFIKTYGIQNVVRCLFHMKRPAPPHRGYNIWVSKIREIEADFVGTEVESTPDLDQVVMMARRSDVSRIV